MRIMELLKARGMVSVDELSLDLDVSAVTIRRDLEALDNKGLLTRTHGGATVLRTLSQALPERRFHEKDVLNVIEKRRIAEKAMDLIKEDEIIFMNSGSTVLFFLRALNKRVRIITNNAAALECERDSRVELMLLGGEYREQSRSLVGEIAQNIIHDIFSSHTVLGTNGLDLDKGLTTSAYQESSINRAMIRNTHGKVIVLADSSKLGHVSNFVSASLDSIDVVITDNACPQDILKGLEAQGIEVILA